MITNSTRPSLFPSLLTIVILILGSIIYTLYGRIFRWIWPGPGDFIDNIVLTSLAFTLAIFSANLILSNKLRVNHSITSTSEDNTSSSTEGNGPVHSYPPTSSGENQMTTSPPTQQPVVSLPERKVFHYTYIIVPQGHATFYYDSLASTSDESTQLLTSLQKQYESEGMEKDEIDGIMFSTTDVSYITIDKGTLRTAMAILGLRGWDLVSVTPSSNSISGFLTGKDLTYDEAYLPTEANLHLVHNQDHLLFTYKKVSDMTADEYAELLAEVGLEPEGNE